MSARLFHDTKTKLAASKRSLRCVELASHLQALGFEVRDGKRGGHKLLFHEGIRDFTSASYNCGHGRNPEIKAAYVDRILKLLEKYQKEIIDYLEAQNHDRGPS
jgi:hypothetical protein